MTPSPVVSAALSPAAGVAPRPAVGAASWLAAGAAPWSAWTMRSRGRHGRCGPGGQRGPGGRRGLAASAAPRLAPPRRRCGLAAGAVSRPTQLAVSHPCDQRRPLRAAISGCLPCITAASGCHRRQWATAASRPPPPAATADSFSTSTIGPVSLSPSRPCHHSVPCDHRVALSSFRSYTAIGHSIVFAFFWP